jgi:hypothetical protein
MAKKKAARRKSKGLLEKHPNLVWLTPLLVVAYLIFAMANR